MQNIFDTFDNYKLLASASDPSSENYIDYSGGFASVLDEVVRDTILSMEKHTRIDREEIIDLFED
ncbi:MAG: hypothetical protein ACXAD7_23775 [Candidatus Kariarchaeaceae archaeon]